MNWHGGYNIKIKGKPSKEVKVLPEPDKLWLPLYSKRFNFTEISVKEGEKVVAGHILAKDPDNYSIPLLAPRPGTVALKESDGHIVLNNIEKNSESHESQKEEPLHIPETLDSAGKKRYKLVSLGAWQFLKDACSGELPDPFSNPEAVIVSVLNLEPYIARGDVELYKRLSAFTRGLEHIQSLLEYQPIYLVLPDIRSEFAKQVREIIRGYAWVKMIQVPLRYPLADLRIIARKLKLKGHVWGLGAHAVLAIDRALTLSRLCDVRVISIGGSGAVSPRHIKVIPGYPIKTIYDEFAGENNPRIINGGALTGSLMQDGQLGLDTECQGLTLIPENRERELFGFLRPGFGRRSYSRCYLSSLRPAFSEAFTTALRGEPRPCVACGMCAEVCPVRIKPYLIHKYLYHDALEEVEAERPDLCVDCALCSFICPSKIELCSEIKEANINDEIGEESNEEVQ